MRGRKLLKPHLHVTNPRATARDLCWRQEINFISARSTSVGNCRSSLSNARNDNMIITRKFWCMVIITFAECPTDRSRTSAYFSSWKFHKIHEVTLHLLSDKICVRVTKVLFIRMFTHFGSCATPWPRILVCFEHSICKCSFLKSFIPLIEAQRYWGVFIFRDCFHIYQLYVVHKRWVHH